MAEGRIGNASTMTATLHLSVHLCVVEAVGPAAAVDRAKALLLALPRQATSLGSIVDMERPGYVSVAETTMGESENPAHTWPNLLEAALRYPDPTVTLRVSLQSEGQDERVWVVRGGEELCYQSIAAATVAGGTPEVLQETGDASAWARAPR